jgi:BirA family biotin operon repressor/biotin-[acetyl-CoA-carboxylase] ligase
MAVSLPSGVKPRMLLALLADGRPRTGAWLADELKVTRAAIGQGVQGLRTAGVQVHASARRGYRLAEPVELLDAARIVSELGARHAQRLSALEVLFAVDSTNTRLLAAPPPPAGHAHVCLCELQHAGRGRRGRRWIAPFGGGVAMSLAWTFGAGVRTVPALSLAVGVAVARALTRAGAVGVTLKWPNDIVFHDRKLGGVLVELRAEPDGAAHAVIGVGINVALSPAARRELDAAGVRVAAAAEACAGVPSRNLVAGSILDELLSMLERFEREGFAAYRDAWTALDALNGRTARVSIGDAAVTGTARGVDEDGALLIETQGQIQRFVSGEASLRVIEGVT